MRILCLALLAYTLLYATPVHAASADVREIARLNSCAPKKIEVFQQKVGPNAPTTYRVACVTPKVVDTSTTKMASAVLIQCTGQLCKMVRPLYDASN